MPTSTSVAQVGLPAGSAPAVDTGHALSVRGRVRSTASVTLRMLLFQGATQITAGALETDALTTQIASYVLPIASADVAGISSYSGLSVKFWAFSAAGDTPVVEVEEVFLSLPKAGTGVAHFDRPSGNVTLAGAVAEFNIAASAPADTPRGNLVLAGGVVEFHVAAVSPAETPVGRLLFSGRTIERLLPPTVHADAPVGVLRIAGAVAEKAPSVVGVARGLGLQQTAMLGTPGVVQLGYFYTGAAVWHGPFATEIALGITSRARLVAGQQVTVAPSVASQFAAADATWWEFH